MFTRIANSFRLYMCPTVALLCLMVALSASKAAANPSAPSPHAIDIPRWFSESFLDFREDIADAAGQGKRLLVYFGQDGCPYCTQLMKVNFSQPDIVARTRQNFVPVALNLWGDREVTWIDGRRMSEKELGQMLKVQFTPTMLFFDETGKIALRLNGYSPPGKFRLALEYVSRRRDARESFAEYVAATSTAKPGGKLISEPFFVRGAMNLPRMLTASDKPVLLVFEQRNCRECEELHREAFQRREVRQLLDKFTVAQVDIAGTRQVVPKKGLSLGERELARELGISYAPSLIFFGTDGEEIFRAEGYLRPFHIAAALDYVAGSAWREEPSFQRFIQKRADELRAAGHRVNIWE